MKRCRHRNSDWKVPLFTFDSFRWRRRESWIVIPPFGGRERKKSIKKYHVLFRGPFFILSRSELEPYWIFVFACGTNRSRVWIVKKEEPRKPNVSEGTRKHEKAAEDRNGSDLSGLLLQPEKIPRFFATNVGSIDKPVTFYFSPLCLRCFLALREACRGRYCGGWLSSYFWCALLN